MRCGSLVELSSCQAKIKLSLSQLKSQAESAAGVQEAAGKNAQHL